MNVVSKTAVRLAIATLSCVASVQTPVWAETGKLVLTGGVTTVEGTAGGGITPWAVIGTLATDRQWGVSANLTHVNTDDYTISSRSATLAWSERFEVSMAEQRLDTGKTGVALGLPGLDLEQRVIGAKYRLSGDAILDTDTWWPQIAVGVQFKQLDSHGLKPTLKALGAETHGTDVYVSATKLFLQHGWLVNGTLRATKANQNGFLGFGGRLGGNEQDYDLMPEVSVAKLLDYNLAIGAEYRRMPDKLREAGQAAGLGNGLAADDWMDVFVAWAPSKYVSLTAAYVNLGRIVPATTNDRNQTGFYLSGQLNF